jgi:hypothetical protein
VPGVASTQLRISFHSRPSVSSYRKRVTTSVLPSVVGAYLIAALDVYLRRAWRAAEAWAGCPRTLREAVIASHPSDR